MNSVWSVLGVSPRWLAAAEAFLNACSCLLCCADVSMSPSTQMPLVCNFSVSDLGFAAWLSCSGRCGGGSVGSWIEHHVQHNSK